MTEPQNIVNALSMEARITRTARMLSMDQPVTAENITAIIQDYRAYTYKHNVTDAQVAKQTGYSASVISQWQTGKYRGDVDAVTRAINDWIERDSKQRGVQISTAYVPTRVAEAMRGIIISAMASGSMAAIIAPSGVGKTLVFQIMQEKSNGFYLYCDEDISPRSFLIALADAIGLRLTTQTASLAAIKSLIIGKLKGSRRPIFLDEAHRLRAGIFSRIRSIYDQSGVPIIFGGTSEMYDHINDRAAERGQMASRCLVFNAMDYAAGGAGGSASGGGEPLYTRDEIEKLFEGSKVKIHPEAYQMLWAIACSPSSGALRTVRKVVELIHSLQPGHVITRKSVREALSQLFGRLGQTVEYQANQMIEDMKKTG